MFRRTLLLLSAVLMLGGCSFGNSSLTGNLAADYVKGSIKSVVMFPVLNPLKAAVYQPALQSELTLALQEKNNTLRFMATNEALTRLMTSDTALASRNVAEAVFNQTPINQDEVKTLYSVLGIDAAIICGYTAVDEKTVEMPVYILDLRSGQVIWHGVSKGWQAPVPGQGRFSPALSKAMTDGLVNLHKILPVL